MRGEQNLLLESIDGMENAVKQMKLLIEVTAS